MSSNSVNSSDSLPSKSKLTKSQLNKNDRSFISRRNKDKRNVLGFDSDVKLLPSIKDISLDAIIANKEMVEGYILESKVPPFSISLDTRYRAINCATLQKVMIKYSPYSLEQTTPLSKFLNEWFLLSGLNPKEIDAKSIDSVTNFGNDQPVSLPRDIPGILYPIDFYYSKSTGASALIYDNESELINLTEKFILTDSNNPKFLAERSPSTTSLPSNFFSEVSQKLVYRSAHDIVEILKIIIQVLKTLKKVHDLGFTNNGLTTLSIFVNKDNDVFIEGWDFAFSRPFENCTKGYRATNKDLIAWVMPYTSPEATGHFNKLCDYKSDFYSLGIIMYELLVGFLPFQSTDVGKVILAHIYQTPISPYVISSWIPQRLSDAVMRCLEKLSINRFDDCNELINELTLSIAEITGQPISDKLYPYRFNPRFLYPKDSYNRKRDLQQLIDKYENGSQGVCTIYITGEKGAGKSSILGDFKTYLVGKRSLLFAEWHHQKFRNSDSTYNMFVSIIRKLLSQIISSGPKAIKTWRSIIIRKIDDDLRLVQDVFPELKQLVGLKHLAMTKEQLFVGESQLDMLPAKFECRFQYLIKLFFSLFASYYPEGLTILIDDDQFQTKNERLFFTEVINFVLHHHHSKSKPKMRIISTLLDGSGHEGSYLSFTSLTPEKLLSEDTRNDYIKLSPLTYEAVQHFLSDFLPLTDFPRQDHISRMIYDIYLYRKTPLVMRTSLDVLVLNNAFQIRNGKAIFNFENTFKKAPKNLTEFYHGRVDELWLSDSKKILIYAACVCSGNPFSLHQLAVVSGLSIQDTYIALYKIIAVSLIVPLGIDYKVPFHLLSSSFPHVEIASEEISKMASTCMLEFSHDTLQDYILGEVLTTEELKNYHRLCALRLFDDIESLEDLNYARLIHVTRHFVESIDAAIEDDFQIYSEVLIYGGRLAYDNYDFELSLFYFQSAKKFRDHSSDDEEVLDLHKRLDLTIVQLHFIIGNYEDCIKIVDEVLDSYDVLLDRASFLINKLKSLFALGKFEEAIKLSIESLRMFDINVQTDKEWNKEYQARVKPRMPLSVTQIRSLAQKQADASDPNNLARSEVLACFLVPMLSNNYDDLSKTLLYVGIIDVMENGYCPSHAWVLIGFSILIVKEDHQSSFMRSIEYANASLKMLEDSDTSLELGTSIYEIYCGSMALFCEPVEVVAKYHDVFVANNRVYISTYFEISSFIALGIKNVVPVIAGTENLSSIMLRNSNHDFDSKAVLISETEKAWIQMGIGFLKCLTGTSSPSSFTISKFENQYFVVEQYDYAFYVMKFFLSYISEDFDTALEILFDMIPKSEKLLPLTGYKIVSVYCGSLLLLKHPGEDQEEKLKRSVILNEYLQYLDIWTTTCPNTFQTKNMLVKAVQESQAGNKSSIDILDMFEQVIDRAKAKGQLFDQALGCELCALWLLGTSTVRTRAAKFMKEALRVYDLWGCTAKVTKLSEEYHDLVHNYNWAGVDILTPSSEGTSPSLPKTTAPLQLLFSSFFSQNEQAIHTSGDETEETDENHISSFRRSSSETTLVDMKLALATCVAISEAVDRKKILTKLIENTANLMDADFAVIALKDPSGNLYLECAVSNQKIRIMDHEPLLSRNDICPISLIKDTFTRGTMINREDDPIFFDNKYMDEDFYYQSNSVFVAVCIPIKDQNEVIGAMYLENQHQPKQRSKCFTSEKLDIAVLFCTQLAFSLYKASLYEQMDLARELANAATEEKANFLNSMSHEIRTPFNSLLSCALFLLDTELTDSQRDYVETIKNSSMVTLNIIDGILSFAKIENSSVTLDELPFSINDCIESALQLVSEQASTKKLELININYCNDIDTILGDITRFRQVIVNIVGNAVKFTSQGHVLVETKCHKISLDNRYEFIITVKDTGIGIPRDSHSKVFGAFSQVDGSARRVYGGAGLGLAISKKIVDIMGGSLTFESEENVGTTFSFSVILKVAESRRKHPEIGVGKKVLVVETNPLTCLSLQNEISSYGFEVVVFDTACKLLKALETVPFSVVFCHRRLINDTNEQFVDELIKKYKDTKFILMGPFGIIHNKNFDRILLLPFMKLKLYEILMPLNETTNEKKLVLTKESMSTLAENHPLSILLAEDNMINTKVTLLHLRRMGYKLDHAADGLIVLDKCAKRILETGKNYDVILMDIQMPNMDGIQSCTKLMELYLDSNLKPEVIALTANVIGEDRKRCAASGMSNFISKPLLPNDLAQLLLHVQVEN